MPGQTGSAQIHAQARPDLCWQAAGNGSPVTLEHCGSAEGQQWTLAGRGVPANGGLTNGGPANGVLMNGNGYCLQAGPPLAIGFDGQCDGQAGQLWTYRGATGLFTSQTVVASQTGVTGPGHGNCAVLGGPLVPGTPVVSGACAGGTRWSLGSGVIPVQPAVSARPEATPGRVVVQPAAAPAAGSTAGAGAGAGAGAAAGGGLLLAALLAGLLLMTGATLVFFGRRSRAAGRPAARPALGRAADTPDDDGPYVVDVTDEVARRQRAQEVVDSRPTEPFDVSALP